MCQSYLITTRGAETLPFTVNTQAADFVVASQQRRRAGEPELAP